MSSVGEPLRVSTRAFEGMPSRSMSKSDRRRSCPSRHCGSASDCVPVLRDLGIDDFDVVGVALAEAAVLDRDAGGAILEFYGGLGDADARGLAGDGFGGRRGDWLDVLWRSRCGFSAVLIGFVIFSGIATASGVGGGSVLSLVTTGAGLGASDVRTPVSSVRCVGGRGIDETMVAWIAPAVEAFSPQWAPRVWKRNAQPTMIAATRPCRTREPAKSAPSLSPSM